jgi:hypothetical protein
MPRGKWAKGEFTNCHRAADAPIGLTAKKTAFSLYPDSISLLAELDDQAGVSNKSQIVRAAIAFAAKNKDVFLAGVAV